MANTGSKVSEAIANALIKRQEEANKAKLAQQLSDQKNAGVMLGKDMPLWNPKTSDPNAIAGTYQDVIKAPGKKKEELKLGDLLGAASAEPKPAETPKKKEDTGFGYSSAYEKEKRPNPLLMLGLLAAGSLAAGEAQKNNPEGYNIRDFTALASGAFGGMGQQQKDYEAREAERKKEQESSRRSLAGISLAHKGDADKEAQDAIKSNRQLVNNVMKEPSFQQSILKPSQLTKDLKARGIPEAEARVYANNPMVRQLLTLENLVGGFNDEAMIPVIKEKFGPQAILALEKIKSYEQGYGGGAPANADQGKTEKTTSSGKRFTIEPVR